MSVGSDLSLKNAGEVRDVTQCVALLGEKKVVTTFANLLASLERFGPAYSNRFTKEELLQLKQWLSDIMNAADCILSVAPFVSKETLEALLNLYTSNMQRLLPVLESWFTHFGLPFEPNKSLDLLTDRITDVINQSNLSSFSCGLGMGLLFTPLFVGGMLCLSVAAMSFEKAERLKTRYNLNDNDEVAIFYQMVTMFREWYNRDSIQQFSQIISSYSSTSSVDEIVHQLFLKMVGANEPAQLVTPVERRNVGGVNLSSPSGLRVVPRVGYSKRHQRASYRRNSISS